MTSTKQLFNKHNTAGQLRGLSSGKASGLGSKAAGLTVFGGLRDAVPAFGAASGGRGTSGHSGGVEGTGGGGWSGGRHQRLGVLATCHGLTAEIPV